MRLIVSTLLFLLLTGCLVTGLTHVDSDRDFNWDTLKRDQILMTPLLDLRTNPTVPTQLSQGNAKDLLEFFSVKDQRDYAEQFKQAFFRLRKDIRVFGAGGAFEHLAGQEKLPQHARLVLAKSEVPRDEWLRMVDGAQDIRFFFFFAITDEALSYDYHFSPPPKNSVVALKSYQAVRTFNVKLALWDSLKNKTVWIGTEQIKNVNTNTIKVPRGRNRSSVSSSEFSMDLDAIDLGGPSNLTTELSHHLKRFPAFPGREPNLSGTFDDFALSLPIQPSEENLIEYSWMTYHRPLFTLRFANLGRQNDFGFLLSTSSIYLNRHRFGGFFGGSLLSIEVENPTRVSEDLNISYSDFGGTYFYESPIDQKWRILSGTALGWKAYRFEKVDRDQSNDSSSKDEPEVDESTVDTLYFVAPGLRVNYGDKRGLQWEFGASYRWFGGFDLELSREYRPSNWAVDMSVGWCFRGF